MKTLFKVNWFVLAESDLSQQLAMRTHVLEFCQALSRRAPVTLLSNTPSNVFAEELPFAAIPLSSHPFQPHTLSLIRATFSAYAKLRRLYHEQPIAILYIRATAFGIGPLLFARRFRVPAILEINGAWSEEQKLSRTGLPTWKRLWVTPVQWARAASLDLACRLAPKIVVVTPQLASYLQSKGISEHKITVAPNGVNTQRFAPKSQQQARAGLHLDPATQYIGFVGSLTAWQGLETLIEAFANLPDDAGRCPRLLIIGDGSQRQNLENLAHRTGSSARIHFTGAIPYTQIPDFIAACDVLAAPKRPLTSGYSTLKILEYMACARPVIASRVAGMEMIEQAGAGLLSIPGDPIDLQRTISQILDLPEAERLAMGQRARQFVVEHCTWEYTVDRILALAAP